MKRMKNHPHGGYGVEIHVKENEVKKRRLSEEDGDDKPTIYF